MNQLMRRCDYRKWLICKELDQKKEITVQRLATVCDCTSKTLLLDIQEINDNYSTISGMPILKKNTRLIYIEADQMIPLNAIYKKILTQSHQFKLLNEVVENSDTTLSEFSRGYYISYSPIYKTIIKLNAYLAAFELQVIKFKLVGEEYKICIFLFHFYWTLFGGGKWPFKTIAKNQCKEEVAELETAFSTHFTWVEHEKLCFLVAVLAMRERLRKKNMALNEHIYWKTLDEEGNQLIKNSDQSLSLKLIKNGQLLLKIAQFLICDQTKLKTAQLGLSNFNDSFSKASEHLLMRLKKDFSKDRVNEIQEAQKELIKFIHYSQLGEAYTLLALKIEQERSNLINLKTYPELEIFLNKQASQIIQILTVQNLVMAPNYYIYIATKYGEGEMKKIKGLLEASSPDNFSYISLWNINENVEVILTDFEKIPEREDCLQLQFMYPFNEKKASEIVARLKIYFQSKGEIL